MRGAWTVAVGLDCRGGVSRLLPQDMARTSLYVPVAPALSTQN
jgi:hypothetical protein